MNVKLTKYLEIATNLAIIAVAIMLGYLLIQKYFLGENKQPQPTEIVKGTKNSLPDVSWQQNKKTLLLVLQKDCHFCSESMPFYKTLVEKSKEKGIKLIAVLPNSREESIQYLKENGVDIQEVKQAQISEINVKGTPTLILVNNQGEVENSWIGQLPLEKENEVINNL
jgi:thioredoxin-related protein